VLERLPMLGTGKVDQVSVVKLARERAAGEAPAAA
jgi:acyl-[acyl-carrier-protein]-phospholipid O-acyltransferase/long-chain-fatty-acid--[acyl-carrier-protein] ligase